MISLTTCTDAADARRAACTDVADARRAHLTFDFRPEVVLIVSVSPSYSEASQRQAEPDQGPMARKHMNGSTQRSTLSGYPPKLAPNAVGTRAPFRVQTRSLRPPAPCKHLRPRYGSTPLPPGTTLSGHGAAACLEAPSRVQGPRLVTLRQSVGAHPQSGACVAVPWPPSDGAGVVTPADQSQLLPIRGPAVGGLVVRFTAARRSWHNVPTGKGGTWPFADSGRTPPQRVERPRPSSRGGGNDRRAQAEW